MALPIVIAASEVPALISRALPVVTLAPVVSSLISNALWQSSQAPPAWGVYDPTTGKSVLDPDSVLEFSYRREFDISDFPVQEGAFASYNKVIKPFEIQLRFSKGGTQSDRGAFLRSLDNLVASLTLYQVRTPEGVYENCNPQRYEVTRRGAQGAFFLTEVDLYLVQIVQVTAQYGTTGTATPFIPGISALPNSSSAAAQPTSNVGNAQPQNVDSSLASTGQLALSNVKFF